jgi:hypothetical protein
MYDVDTEHVNGEGYVMHNQPHNPSVGVMGWVYIAVFVVTALLVGWLFAVAIGGF